MPKKLPDDTGYSTMRLGGDLWIRQGEDLTARHREAGRTTPTPRILATIRNILSAHNPLEEDSNGLYETYEELAGSELDALLDRARSVPEVKLAPHSDRPAALESMRQSVERAGHRLARRTSLTDRNLSSASQAGLVNNLNDGMAWGLFPLVYAAAGLSLAEIGWLAAIYPAVWGLGQLWTGALSDRIGRKGLIASGMGVQAAGIATIAVSQAFPGFAMGAFLLGAGTAMVYPTLLAAIGDLAHPAWRAGAVGVYRLWRDLGYAVGALLAGITADALGLRPAVWVIAAVTLLSGIVMAVRMSETRRTHETSAIGDAAVRK